MKKKIISKTYLREADKYQIKFYLDEEDYHEGDHYFEVMKG